LTGTAYFSKCGRYRYRLTRNWEGLPLFYRASKPAVFIGLNPSTANSRTDDPTIRRCVGFAKEWGCGGIVMVNLFALVSADPQKLITEYNPVGRPENDSILDAATWLEGAVVVACWGAFRQAKARAAEVAARLGDRGLQCLGTNADGSPKHPLYLPKGTPLVPFGGAEVRP